jgi:hypothetical protein
MYYGGLLNGAPFFTQPGGPGTQVFPTQANNIPWTDYPTVGLVLSEISPWWFPPCLHSIKSWKLIREFDYETNQSCCLICCEVCSFVVRAVIPYEEILNPIQYAIVIA